MALFGLVAIFAGLFWYEDNRIRRYGGGSGERWAFIVGMVIAVAYACAVLLDAPIPSPAALIQSWLGDVGRWILPDET